MHILIRQSITLWFAFWRVFFRDEILSIRISFISKQPSNILLSEVSLNTFSFFIFFFVFVQFRYSVDCFPSLPPSHSSLPCGYFLWRFFCSVDEEVFELFCFWRRRHPFTDHFYDTPQNEMSARVKRTWDTHKKFSFGPTTYDVAVSILAIIGVKIKIKHWNFPSSRNEFQ